MRECEVCKLKLPKVAYDKENSITCRLCKLENRARNLINRIENEELLSINDINEGKVIVRIIGDKKNRTIDRDNLMKAFKPEEIFVVKKDLVIVKPIIPNQRSSFLTIERVKHKNGYRCLYCGSVSNTIDHFIPLSKGGTWDEYNLIPSCANCNSIKDDIIYENITIARSNIRLQKKNS